MKYLSTSILFFCASLLYSQTSDFIHVDQFGYLRDADKVAVISNPQIGFNSDKSYQPGEVLEVRKAENDEVVYSAEITMWKAGELHNDSGDYGWWFDFAGVTQSGSYYVHDPSTGESSATFKIGKDVYDDVLQAAFKAFYYNRCNATKEEPYADARWVDGTNFLNAEQDANCLFIYDRENESLVKDLSGGWFDAGDYNKYVTFAHQPIHNMLWAYQENPEVFGDDWNIPESGNGLPDILDEVKWELDWLLKMNSEDGTTIIKMGSQNHSENISAPPSINTDRRFYGPDCSAASIAVASMFAHAAKVYSEFPEYEDYSELLEQRAVAAWDYVQQYVPSSFQTSCDDGSIISGDADWDNATQLENVLTGAIHLFDLTGELKYDDYIRANYESTEQLINDYWGAYKMPLNDALLHYSTLSIATSAVANDILDSFSNDVQNNNNGYYGSSFEDLYRAYMPEWSYHWGSNMVKANYGNLNNLIVKYGIDPVQADAYGDYQREVVHYFHGVNPLGLVYLSNMYELGGDKCANEIYHTWFADGTEWDNAISSAVGPPPGFVTGGPNKDFSLSSISPPSGQPALKSYLDFNTGWPDNSWEISEPAIYYQAAYIRMLSGIMSVNNSTTSTIDRAAVDFDFSLYPNPAQETIKLRGDLEGKRLSILNTIGQNVQSTRAQKNSFSWDVSSLNAGIYFVSVSDDKGRLLSIEKLIKT